MRRPAFRYGPALVVVAIFLVLFIALLPALAPTDLTRDHSIFRKNLWGCAALAELCRRAEPSLRVEALTRPLDDLQDIEGALLILDAEQPLSPSELSAIKNWVKAGGTLIAAFEGEWDDPAGVKLGAEPGYAALADALGVQLQECGRQLANAAPVPTSPLARGVRRVSIRTSYCLTASSTPSQDHNALHLHPLRSHLTADGKPIFGSRRLGRGEVFLSSDVAMFSNEMLAREDNLQFVANLLWPRARGRCLYFDEYHHGFGHQLHASSDVDPAPLHRAIFLAAAGVAIFLAGKAQRFGAPVPAFRARRRAAMEHVEALAALFRRGEANDWALGKIAADVRQRLAVAGGLPPSAQLETIALQLAQRRGIPSAETISLFGQVEAALKTGRIPLRHLFHLVTRLSDLEKQAGLTGSASAGGPLRHERPHRRHFNQR